MPALKALDPAAADARSKDQSEISALLVEYPQGQRSVDPWLRDTPMKDGEEAQTSYSYVHDSVGSAAPEAVRVETDQTIKNFSVIASQNPDSAINSALGIAELVTRLRVLIGIAQTTVARNPSAAKDALREALKSARQDEDGTSTVPWGIWKDAARVGIQLQDSALMDAALKAGFKSARRLYDEDSNTDDPNEALKLYWPSVQAYRELIGMETKVSLDAALATVRNLPDPEVGALEKVMLASDLLKQPAFHETSPMVEKRREISCN